MPLVVYAQEQRCQAHEPGPDERRGDDGKGEGYAAVHAFILSMAEALSIGEMRRARPCRPGGIRGESKFPWLHRRRAPAPRRGWQGRRHGRSAADDRGWERNVMMPFEMEPTFLPFFPDGRKNIISKTTLKPTISQMERAGVGTEGGVPLISGILTRPSSGLPGAQRWPEISVVVPKQPAQESIIADSPGWSKLQHFGRSGGGGTGRCAVHDALKRPAGDERGQDGKEKGDHSDPGKGKDRGCHQKLCKVFWERDSAHAFLDQSCQRERPAGGKGVQHEGAQPEKPSGIPAREEKQPGRECKGGQRRCRRDESQKEAMFFFDGMQRAGGAGDDGAPDGDCGDDEQGDEDPVGHARILKHGGGAVQRGAAAGSAHAAAAG